ncbi:MAG: dihydrofolate reductase family protein [Bacteroidales bacterium]
MGKIILFNMMTIDGFFEGPDKEIDWHNVDNEFNTFAVEQLSNASALIFGRLTYELMAGYWPTAVAQSDDPIVAEKMNAIQKIVFSKTLDKTDWNNTRLIKKNIEHECKNLKQQSDHDVFIFGSANLASALIDLDLIDEFRIMINPIILGQGNVLFKPSNGRLNLRLINIRSFKSGNVLLYYEPSR